MAISVTPRHKHAMVTVLIGEEYQHIWKLMCKPSWERYAAKYGYDLIVIDDYLDGSERGRARSPAWQKLCILNQPWSSAYERIIWVDADIIIGASAPNLLHYAPDPSRLGIATNTQMTEADKHIYLERQHNFTLDPEQVQKTWKMHEDGLFTPYGITEENLPMLNTGVLVLSPAHHRELFERLYQEEDRGRLYEQPYLVRALFKEGIGHEIPARFNWNIHELYVLFRPQNKDMPVEYLIAFIRNELNKAYFLHFCGSMAMLRLLAKLTEINGDVLGVQ